ncbi:MAG: hypothetical protein U5L72_05520 [Bacteroidales bacterium]|nr:hypothetical protein [Bacteroidales bacterium]
MTLPPISVVFIISAVYLVSCSKPTPPAVTTANVSAITYTTATSGGNVTGDGGADIISRGVCWNTSAKPTVSNSKTSDGQGTGSFSSNLTQLTPGTPYYVRAYATMKPEPVTEMKSCLPPRRYPWQQSQLQ